MKKPIDEREVIFEVRRAQFERINAINDFLIDLLVRTRKQQPAHIIIDLDPTADPTHGQQQLTMFNGFYDQHQYLPMMLFEGTTGFPLHLTVAGLECHERRFYTRMNLLSRTNRLARFRSRPERNTEPTGKYYCAAVRGSSAER